MPLFRVRCEGSDLEFDDLDAVADASTAEYETGWGSPHGHGYYFLVCADTQEAAILSIRQAVGPLGEHAEFTADEVLPPPGWKGLNQREIDWPDVHGRCRLTELQQTLLDGLLDAAEPTWILLKHLELTENRDTVEAALRELEQRGLLLRTREPSGAAGATGDEPENWWMITDNGWEMLGLIKRPSYH